MKKYLLLLVAIYSGLNVFAGPSVGLTIVASSGLTAVVSGNLQLNVKSGGACTFNNDGTFAATTGTINVLSATTFTGTGTTGFGSLVFNTGSGTSLFNSLVSVYNTTTITAGNVNANNNLHVRSDVGGANLANTGSLTGNVQGLVASATTTSGPAPSYTSDLSLNVSGSVMAYQWQSSPDSSTWTNIAGATNATYTATVTATTYYRNNLSTTNTAFTESTPGVELLLVTVPVFNNGSPQPLTVCENSAALDITSALHISDAETGKTETWTVTGAPDNGGTLTGFSSANTAVSGSTDIAPGNTVTYQPANNFSGVESFTIQVTDGTATASTVFSATVKALPVVSVSPVSGVLCLGGSEVFTVSANNSDTVLNQNFNTGLTGAKGGTWSIVNTAAFPDAAFQIKTSGASLSIGDGSAMMEAAGVEGSFGIPTETEFRSPAFSTTEYSSANLSFNQALVSATPDIAMTIDYSTNGGSSWTTITDQTYLTINGGGTWSAASPQYSTALPAGALGQPNVMLRWNYFGSTFYWDVDNIRLTGTRPVSYTWTGAAGLSCTTCASPTITPTVTGASIYTVAATFNGCTGTTTLTASVNPVPSSTGITHNNPICVGGTVTLSDNSSNATAWTWTGSDGFASTLRSPAASPTVTTTYSLTASSTGNGCTSPVYTTTVTVNQVPVSTGITHNNPICVGGTASLNSNSGTATTWTWSGSDGFSSSAANPSATPTVTTTYSLTVASTGNGCAPETVYTTMVTVNNVPSSTGITNNNPVCAGGTVNFNSNTSDATAWTWSGSDGFSSSAVNPSATPTVTTTYSLTISSTGDGCAPETVYTTSVTVNDVPSSTGITNNNPICIGGTASLHSNSSAATIWTWSGSDGFSSSAANPSATPTVTTTYSLTVASTGDGCAPETVYTATVTVNNVPSSTGITNNNPICIGGTVNFNSNTSDATAWTWSGSDGFSSSATNPSATPTVTTTYSLTISSTGDGCAPETIYTASVTVNNVPSSTGITNNNPICIGGTASLHSNSSDATIWTWTGSDGFTSSAANPSATPAVTTTYSLTVSSVGDGCSPETIYTTSVTVNNVPSSTGITNNNPICIGGTVNFNANSSDATTWTWSGSDGFTSSATDPSATPVVTTTYSLTLSSIGDGCSPETVYTTTVTVNNVPSSTGITSNNPVCLGDLVSFSDNSIYATSWTWSGSDGFSSTLQVPTTTPTATTTYSLTLSAEGDGCNPGTVYTSVVTVNPIPNVVVPFNQAVCNGLATVPVSFTGSVTPTTYTWTNSNSTTGLASTGTSDIGAFTVTNTTTATDTSVITITPSASGCTGAAQSFLIIAYPTPQLSSSLTPPDICDSTLFVYGPGSLTDGTTYAWNRAFVPGISVLTNSGADTVKETLVNNTADPLAVTYVYTVTANGCSAVEQVVVNVNPKPLLSSPLINGQCDSLLFHYHATSATSGSSFVWRRPYTGGIYILPGAGTGNIDDTLINTTYDNVTVTYTYTITANGCSDSEHVAVVVHPTPKLSSAMGPYVVCSGQPFGYSPTSFTPTTGYTWSRDTVAGVSPGTGTGSGAVAETLVNSSNTPQQVTYVYTLAAYGCFHSEDIPLTLNPTPTPLQITTAVSNVCENTLYQNFGVSAPPAAYQSYAWTASGATVTQGATGQYCIVDFTTPGNAIIKLTITIDSTGCQSDSSYMVTVGAGSGDQPFVVYSFGEFVCLQNNVTAYQWGYDNKHTLDSTILIGQINQSYANSNPDTVNNYYWVMTNQGGCQRKAYYNLPAGPTGTANIDKSVTEIEVYPNPANSVVNVAITTAISGNMQVMVSDMLGRKINTAAVVNNKAAIDVSGLAAGCYFIDCYRDGIKIGAAKFIKN